MCREQTAQLSASRATEGSELDRLSGLLRIIIACRAQELLKFARPAKLCVTFVDAVKPADRLTDFFLREPLAVPDDRGRDVVDCIHDGIYLANVCFGYLVWSRCHCANVDRNVIQKLQ